MRIRRTGMQAFFRIKNKRTLPDAQGLLYQRRTQSFSTVCIERGCSILGRILEQTAYQWIKRAKAQHIHQEITQGLKPLKKIAEENGFSSMAQFPKFCKKELGETASRIRKGIKV